MIPWKELPAWIKACTVVGCLFTVAVAGAWIADSSAHRIVHRVEKELNNCRATPSGYTCEILPLDKAFDEHMHQHFELLEDQLQKLTDRIAALEGKK